MASILIPQPGITSKDGVNFTRDDMEGLYSELANCAVQKDMGRFVENIPAGPPTPNPGEPVDAYCDDVHNLLRFHVRDNDKPVHSDLRAEATPPDRIDEVWNHAIWKYSSTMEEAGGGSEGVIQVTTTIWANWDLDLPPTDGTTDRV